MTTQATARGGRKIGRPKKGGEPLRKISLSLTSEQIERMEAEAADLGAVSVSAVARLAVAEYLRRLEKRRDRQPVE